MSAKVNRYRELYQRNKEINRHFILAFGGTAIGASDQRNALDLDITPEQERGVCGLLRECEQNSEEMSNLRDNWSSEEEIEFLSR